MVLCSPSKKSSLSFNIFAIFLILFFADTDRFFQETRSTAKKRQPIFPTTKSSTYLNTKDKIIIFGRNINKILIKHCCYLLISSRPCLLVE